MEEIRKILQKLLAQEISVDEAEKFLKADLIEEVGELAKLDVFRKTRTGIPEVIYAQNKDTSMLLKIINSFLHQNKFAIISRFTNAHLLAINQEYSENKQYNMEINELGKIIVIQEKNFRFPVTKGKVGIITAGSSDISVAEEAKVIAKKMGCEVLKSYDIGIAGIHRIFAPLRKMILEGVHVIIVCAGMEGTLPGVVAALVDVPVIGVPISSGYGFGEKGKGALITMLQSCSPGLLVVNIDNGFGAGASAAMIANRIAK